MGYGTSVLQRLAGGPIFGLVALFLLEMATQNAQAQEPAIKNEAAMAKRQAIFKARIVDIENLFSSGAPKEEVKDYVQKLRQLADIAEASINEKAARLELLMRRLARIRASMGGAVEVPDEKSLAVYEAAMNRLRKEEEIILREISELERR